MRHLQVSSNRFYMIFHFSASLLVRSWHWFGIEPRLTTGFIGLALACPIHIGTQMETRWTNNIFPPACFLPKLSYDSHQWYVQRFKRSYFGCSTASGLTSELRDNCVTSAKYGLQPPVSWPSNFAFRRGSQSVSSCRACPSQKPELFVENAHWGGKAVDQDSMSLNHARTTYWICN